jgi:hypothetical protein
MEQSEPISTQWKRRLGPMHRKKTGNQMEMVWVEEMQWSDLPEPIREQARKLLGELVRQMAEIGVREKGTGDGK